MASIDALRVWADAHPYLMIAVVWPFVLGFVTFSLKPRTPEQYTAIAAMRPVAFWSRFVVLLQLIGALGLDPVKVVKLLQKLVTPRAIAVLVIVGAIGGTAMSFDGAPRRALFSSGAIVRTGTGCAFFTPAVIDALASKTKCALQNQELSREQIIIKCALTGAETDKVMPQVEASRAASAKAVVAARADEQVKHIGAPTCGPDAGATDGGR